MSKRGSHVGIVLSFVVFILFLVFLYSVLEPTITIQQDKQALLDYLGRELIRNFSTEMIISTITINKTVSKNCIKLENLTAEIGIDNHTIVKNEFENISLSYISDRPNEPNDLLIDRYDNQNRFFKIYNAEEFDEISENRISPCESLDMYDGKYVLGLVRVNEYIFETKIIRLKDSYEDNYEDLRDELKIPSGSDFSFSFTNSSGWIIKTGEKNITTSIYAEEIPIQYVDKEANLLSGFLNVKIW